MKEQILNLRAEGKSYRQIQKILGCSKATISYHCGPGQKEKTIQRTRKLRTENKLIKRVDCFKSLRDRTWNFGKRELSKRNNELELTFRYTDVLEKFGEKTTCYLSGEEINIKEDSHYHLDHVTPASKGGENTIENLGITHMTVNQMKHDLTVEEFIEWCTKILMNQGYSVTCNLK